MLSRVVPGVAVTIARFSASRAFSSDDFPTFGRPMIAARSPSRSSMPLRQREMSSSHSARSSSRRPALSFLEIKPSPSSGKSRSTSSAAASAVSLSISPRIFSVNDPCSDLADAVSASSLRALMMPATASACARSMRPLMKALLVNSPGSAILAPSEQSSSIQRCAESAPPWQCISALSSPV